MVGGFLRRKQRWYSFYENEEQIRFLNEEPTALVMRKMRCQRNGRASRLMSEQSCDDPMPC